MTRDCVFCKMDKDRKIPLTPPLLDDGRVFLVVCLKHRDDMINKGFGGIMLCNRCRHYQCGNNMSCSCDCHIGIKEKENALC